MRRTLHLVLAGLVVLLPIEVHAAGSTSSAHKKKKPKKTRAAEVEQEREQERSQGEDEESQGSRRRRKRQPKTIDVPQAEETGEPKKDAPAEPGKPPAPAEEEEDDSDFEDNPSKWVEALTQKVPPRRYGYVLGVVIGGTGLVFAYQAQGEAKRAETITSAHEAQRAVANARASAALANVLYGLAGAALLLALVLEFIPEPLADKANLTFHF
jgi:hypothetical protein